MNFNDTITKLYEMTDKITVYAGQAYSWIDGDNVPDIGIRSYFAGYQNNDPVVDEVPFMVCGDVYFDCNGKKVTHLSDLGSSYTKPRDFFVILRAVVGFPTVTVDLGKYEVVKKTDIDARGNMTIDLIRMR